MRVAFFITDISLAGGTERITLSLASELINYGYEVTIISLMGESKPFYSFNKSIKFITINKNKKNLFLNYFKIVSKLRKIYSSSKLDYVIDVVTTMSLFSIPAVLFTNIKVITWEHFNFSVDLGKSAMNIGRYVAAKYSSAIVTLTVADQLEYEKRIKCNAQLVTIPNFIHSLPQNISKCDGYIALAVGRLTHQKGFDRLIDIWIKYIHNNPKTEWRLKIIGNGEDELTLKAQIGFSEMNNFVEILPASNHIEKYYLSSSMFLMTSRWEGLPMVLIESQAFGLPAICYNCKTGPAEIITHDINGILVEDGDEIKYLEELTNLISNRDKISKMSINAVNKANDYSPSNVMPLWIDLFNKLKT